MDEEQELEGITGFLAFEIVMGQVSTGSRPWKQGHLPIEKGRLDKAYICVKSAMKIMADLCFGGCSILCITIH